MSSQVDPSAATPEQLLTILTEENQKRRTSRRLLYACFGGGIGLLLLLYLLVWILKGSEPDLAGLSSLVALGGIACAFSTRHRAALEAAKRMEDPRLAGFLIEAYSTSAEKDVAEAAKEGLLVSLPQLHDPDMLDAYQRGLLYKLLSVRTPRDLVKEVLGAVGRVAGAEAIPTLERFRESAMRHKDAEWRRLADGSLLILPDVRMRAAREIIERRTAQVVAEREFEEMRLGLAEP